VIPSVAYTDPEVAWVGLTEDQAKAQGIKVKKGLFPGRPRPRHRQRPRRRLHQAAVRRQPEAHGHGRILGGGIVGTHAGDMIGEIALAIEMGADAVDIGKTIHPHPTLGEHRHGGRGGARQLHRRRRRRSSLRRAPPRRGPGRETARALPFWGSGLENYENHSFLRPIHRGCRPKTFKIQHRATMQALLDAIAAMPLPVEAQRIFTAAAASGRAASRGRWMRTRPSWCSPASLPPAMRNWPPLTRPCKRAGTGSRPASR
jgi:hypothetical protein